MTRRITPYSFDPVRLVSDDAIWKALLRAGADGGPCPVCERDAIVVESFMAYGQLGLMICRCPTCSHCIAGDARVQAGAEDASHVRLVDWSELQTNPVYRSLVLVGPGGTQ